MNKIVQSIYVPEVCTPEVYVLVGHSFFGLPTGWFGLGSSAWWDLGTEH